MNDAHGNAGADIVKAAVGTSLLRTISLIEEYTDILYYEQRNRKGLYFRSDKSKSDVSFKVYDINRLNVILWNDWKMTAVQKLVKGDPVIRSYANALTHYPKPDNKCDWWSCVPSNGYSLWWQVHIFSCHLKQEGCLCSSFVTPESANQLHCRKAYYQIMISMGKE